MAGKALDLTIRERDEVVAFEEIKDTGPEQIHNYAYVAPKVETIAEVDAPVTVLLVIGFESLQDSEFDPRSIPVLLYGPNDLDSDKLARLAIPSLYDLAECSLAEELDHLVCRPS